MAKTQRILPDLSAMAAQMAVLMEQNKELSAALAAKPTPPAEKDIIELSTFTDSKGKSHQMVAFKMVRKMPFSLSLNKCRVILNHAKKVHDLIKDL